MNEFLKNLKRGDVFKTKRGWWIRITEVFADKIVGYFGTDEISVEMPLFLAAACRAVWDRNDGHEMTDPKNPCEWLNLDPATC